MNELDNQMNHVDEQCQLLRENVETLEVSSQAIEAIVEPALKVEKHLDHSMEIVSKMGLDAFYMLDNQVVINYLERAIEEHTKWIEKYRRIVESGKMSIIQTDHRRCTLGHMHYSIQPVHPEVKSLWQKLENNHKKLHECGITLVDAAKRGDTNACRNALPSAEELYKLLQSEEKELIRLITELSSQGVHIFK